MKTGSSNIEDVKKQCLVLLYMRDFFVSGKTLEEILEVLTIDDVYIDMKAIEKFAGWNMEEAKEKLGKIEWLDE